MAITLKIDFVRDYAEILRQRLLAADYPPVANEADEDTITRYMNVLRRKIEPKKRDTKRSRTFSVPSEHQDGFNALVKVNESGGELRPYQSTGVENDLFDDGLLNDFGVHHFHLGVGPHPRNPTFKERTGPLLYGVVTDASLYCLFALPHNEWSNQMLLDIMHEDFPELTKNVTVKNTASQVSGTSRDYTDTEVQQMRNSGINTVSRRWDGAVTIGRGGSVTLSKTAGKKSVAVVRAGIEVRKVLELIEEEARSQIEEHPEAKNCASIDLRLTEKYGKLVAADDAVGLEITVDLEIARPL